MNNYLSIFIGFILSIIFIIVGIYIIKKYKTNYIKTTATINNATCLLYNNLEYLCDIEFAYTVKDTIYFKRINKYIKLVPYRQYDKIEVYYNKNNPSDIEIKNYKYLYAIIPFIIGFTLLILTILTLLSKL